MTAKTDIHQHLWTEPLVEALSRRRELPFVRREHGLTVLFAAGEQPYVVDLDAETEARRAQLVERDGLDRALVCMSSPLGIESLPRADSVELIDAYHEGALALGDPFGVWGALALERIDPDDVDGVLDRGCVGISLPAGALGSVDALARLSPALERLQSRGAPLLVHPGRATRLTAHEASLGDPLWWPALTRYVAEMQAAWLVFTTTARRALPELRVVFAALAGLAPLHAERLHSRGGPATVERDPLSFYDISSYGPRAVSSMELLVGAGQIVYGSDRPVVDPHGTGVRNALGWESFSRNAERVFAREPERVSAPAANLVPGARPARAARPTPAAEPTRAARLARTARPAPAAEPTRVAEPARAVKPTRVAEPTRAVKPARGAKPTRVAVLERLGR